MERIGMMDGKKVKVVIKEVYKHTAACEACRSRKRKCDGKAPCSYCQSKNLQCQFAEQRKRGPKKARITPAETSALATASFESQLLDLSEAHQYFNNTYVEFLKMLIPVEFADAMHPETVAHKIQTYAALALAARILGDAPKAKVYISTARLLTGSVFDSPDPNTIAAMLIMGQYWYFVLDMHLAAYYASMACNLAKISPFEITGRLGAHCQVAMIVLTDTISAKQKAVLLKKVSQSITQRGDLADRIYAGVINQVACFLGTLGLNLSYPDMSSLSNTFNLLDNVETLSDEQRAEFLTAVNNTPDRTQYPEFMSEKSASSHSTFMRDIYRPAYNAIVEWKSGRPQDAMAHAISCSEELMKLQRTTPLLGILSKYANLTKFAFLAKFFYEQNQYFLAKQMCDLIKDICRAMSPEYDFMYNLTEEFITTKLELIRPSYAPDPSPPQQPPFVPTPTPTPTPTTTTTSTDSILFFNDTYDSLNPEIPVSPGFLSDSPLSSGNLSPNSSDTPNSPDSVFNTNELSNPFNINIIGLDVVQQFFN